MTVPVFWVVEDLDVVKDIVPGIFPCGVDPPLDSLTLEQLEEALCDGVVMAVATPTHAAQQVVGLEKILPVVAAELAALIRMHHDFGAWL
jgi:hypothetical protein